MNDIPIMLMIVYRIELPGAQEGEVPRTLRPNLLRGSRFYEELVALGSGLMKGKSMLQGWKDAHPEQHYFSDQIDLYEYINDPGYLAKEETFASWYENPIDLLGRWYLQVIRQLFKDNRIAKGTFVGLGRRLDLKNIMCPVYLLAGGSDDITTREQVFGAKILRLKCEAVLGL